MGVIKKNKLSILVYLTLLSLIVTAACAPAENSSTVGANGQDQPGETGGDASSGGTGQQQPEESDELAPEMIEGAWQDSPHSDTFVLDSAGNNNSCARCHAPINWLPSMDDIPESCLTCKFELEDPPPLIPAGDWMDIPCNVCHEVDKKGNVQPEYAWLEIAAIEEYAEVASPTELCGKCHGEEGLFGHGVSRLGGAHADYTCTECHDPHDTAASCGAEGCHGDVADLSASIPGHDEDHLAVSCAACHDDDGLEVGYREDDGVFTTFVFIVTSDGESRVPFTSHNIALESTCDRCHFAANPWDLSENAGMP